MGNRWPRSDVGPVDPTRELLSSQPRRSPAFRRKLPRGFSPVYRPHPTRPGPEGPRWLPAEAGTPTRVDVRRGTLALPLHKDGAFNAAGTGRATASRLAARGKMPVLRLRLGGDAFAPPCRTGGLPPAGRVGEARYRWMAPRTCRAAPPRTARGDARPPAPPKAGVHIVIGPPLDAPSSLSPLSLADDAYWCLWVLMG